MVVLYGIKNCDVMVKAFRWLDARNIPYTLHNYKEQGIDADTLKTWLQHFSRTQLINPKSTTFKELPEAERNLALTDEGAISLMMQHNSIIKRPVCQFEDGSLYLGWNPDTIGDKLGING